MRLDTLFDNSARVPMTFLSNGGCPVRLMSVELDHPAALAPAPFRRRAGIPMTEIAVTAGENFGFGIRTLRDVAKRCLRRDGGRTLDPEQSFKRFSIGT